MPPSSPLAAPARLALLLALATTACATGRQLHPFRSDGCTLFPDGRLLLDADWQRCCLVHDMAYWRGGTDEERRAADAGLRRCVTVASGDPVLAWTMYLGVRAAGSASLPTPFRWGYGWADQRAAGRLGPAEQRAVDDRMRAWRAAHPGAPRPPWQDAGAPGAGRRE